MVSLSRPTTMAAAAPLRCSSTVIRQKSSGAAKRARTFCAPTFLPENYASPHFNLFRKISKYVLFGGWINFNRSAANLIRTWSPICMGTPVCPSSVRNTESELCDKYNSISEVSCTTTGRSLRVCGQIGVIKIDSTPGCTIGPPRSEEHTSELQSQFHL